jgi:hypothetical protein
VGSSSAGRSRCDLSGEGTKAGQVLRETCALRARTVEGDHRFATLIEENVLNHRIGDQDVMAGQLGNLLAAMTLPSMSLGIIPAAAAREGTMWPLEQFTVFDDTRIHVELLAAKVTVTAPSELDIYLRVFARLTELAVYGADARALIVKAIDALR